MKNQILYSQGWEDPLVLNGALRISERDRVLSITASGDNTLYLLSKGPKKITSVDLNPAQSHLLELKVAAIMGLNKQELLELLGIEKSDKRMKLYGKIKESMPKEARIFWQENTGAIERGVVHSGKLERYLEKYRKFVLPLCHSKSNIDEFVNMDSIDQQKAFYDEVWDNCRWRASFNLFFSKFMLKNGRAKEFFKHNEKASIAQHYLARTKKGMTEIPIKGNYFLQYILTGKYGSGNLPEYLKAENLDQIRQNIGRLEIVTGDVGQQIRDARESFSKFNLSDIFELYSDVDYRQALREIVSVSEDNARVCYWNNLVRRKELVPQLFFDPGAENLKLGDRVFFYDDLVVQLVNKS